MFTLIEAMWSKYASLFPADIFQQPAQTFFTADCTVNAIQ
jgi:hypothetical protein